jgi:hypothetical protein
MNRWCEVERVEEMHGAYKHAGIMPMETSSCAKKLL